MELSTFGSTVTNWPSMAILNSNLLHGTVHHSTKVRADSWNPWIAVTMDRRADGRTGGQAGAWNEDNGDRGLTSMPELTGV